jgi:hypothetical protein
MKTSRCGKRLLEYLAGQFPGLTSLMYVINPKANDTIGDLDVKLFSGRDHIMEAMEDLQFKIGSQILLSDKFLPGNRSYTG